LDRYNVFYKNLKTMINSQSDYTPKDSFTKLKETMKKLFTIALVISASISLHAQQPKRVVKFVFQTDKSGSIVSTNQGEQQFKYNGKEYDPMHGLDLYEPK